LASTILFFSTCSQSEPDATLETTELELLLIEELEVVATDELVATEELLLILDDELVTCELELTCTELDDVVFTELDELVATELDELDGLELDELVTAPSQIAPVIIGFSAVVPPLVP
jgi:hypothetical protein